MIEKYRNNCHLVMAREVTGLGDESILATWRQHGWQPHRGMQERRMLEALAALGAHISTEPGVFQEDARPTLAEFRRLFRRGVFIVGVHRHVLVVRDGVVIDPNWRSLGSRRRVWTAYEVLNAAPGRSPAPSWPPDLSASLEAVVLPVRARRPETDAYYRYYDMWLHLRHNPGASAGEVLRWTRYTRSDLRRDTRRGLVRLG